MNDEINESLDNIEGTSEILIIKKKRGRKPKIIKVENEVLTTVENEISPIIVEQKTEIKKRGRKPTCKIVNNVDVDIIKHSTIDECLIIHLPITKNDIEKMADTSENNKRTINNSIKKSLSFVDDSINVIQDTVEPTVYNKIEIEHKKEENAINMLSTTKCVNCNTMHLKMEELNMKYGIYKLNNKDKILHKINVNMEQIYTHKNIEELEGVCCWWCCETFDTLPIGLPEKIYNDVFYVTGYFCSFNCSLAYNMNLNDHKMWDRVSLLYHLRNTIFFKLYPNGHSKILDDIIMAPPKYLLKKFGGEMTIEEFRNKSIVLKKQFRNVMQNITSIYQLIEETSYNAEQNSLIKTNKIINTIPQPPTDYVLKRNKNTKNSSSLLTMMKIVCN